MLNQNVDRVTRLSLLGLDSLNPGTTSNINRRDISKRAKKSGFDLDAQKPKSKPSPRGGLDTQNKKSSLSQAEQQTTNTKRGGLDKQRFLAGLELDDLNPFSAPNKQRSIGGLGLDDLNPLFDYSRYKRFIAQIHWLSFTIPNTNDVAKAKSYLVDILGFRVSNGHVHSDIKQRYKCKSVRSIISETYGCVGYLCNNGWAGNNNTVHIALEGKAFDDIYSRTYSGNKHDAIRCMMGKLSISLGLVQGYITRLDIVIEDETGSEVNIRRVVEAHGLGRFKSGSTSPELNFIKSTPLEDTCKIGSNFRKHSATVTEKREFDETFNIGSREHSAKHATYYDDIISYRCGREEDKDKDRSGRLEIRFSRKNGYTVPLGALVSPGRMFSSAYPFTSEDIWVYREKGVRPNIAFRSDKNNRTDFEVVENMKNNSIGYGSLSILAVATKTEERLMRAMARISRLSDTFKKNAVTNESYLDALEMLESLSE